jgi:DNA polymerase
MGVGEAPGAEEEVQGVPFVGQSGQELTRMLHDAGLIREEGYLANVCKYRPPENKIEAFFLDSKMTKPNELIQEGIRELREEIQRVRPKIIVAFGAVPMWALTGQKGIMKWRGSMLEYEDNGFKACLMPTYHPAAIMREWAWRSTAVHDLRRVKRCLDEGSWPKPGYKFLLRPSFEDTMDVLGTLLRRANDGPLSLASDLETRAGFVACHCIAWSSTEAISIPFMCVERPTGYWTLDQETVIWERQRALLTHPNVSVAGQNYLYDSQYFARRWGYIPRVIDDTLIMQNVAFPGQPRDLSFLSSMYRGYHKYWKDEGKNWNHSMPEDQLWSYNCVDGVATFECRIALEGLLRALGLWELYRFQMEVWYVALEMMLRGIKIDTKKRGAMAGQLIEAMTSREADLAFILRAPLNVRSPKQVHSLFYEQIKCRVIKDRKTRKPTCNDDAMEVWAREEPLLRPLTQLIADVRSIGTVLSNVVKAELDLDGRMRSSFDPAKETFRWSSSENAFGGGCNLQNWTKGDEDKEKSALRPGQAIIPNVRKLIVPDEGCEIASPDLTGADAQTVAWEADDADLKRVFRENKVKIHAYNAMAVFKDKAPTGYEQPYYDYIRTGVHLVNYGGKAATLAGALVTSEWEAQGFIDYWFRLHPGIKDWHDRIQSELNRARCIYNAFGYRRFYFDRVKDILPEALAWIGQSTTACITNRALVALRQQHELLNDLQIQLLLQVHDEILFQYPIRYREQVLRAVRPIIHIPVPYKDPLVIPWGLKTSEVSWGDCHKRDWP